MKELYIYKKKKKKKKGTKQHHQPSDRCRRYLIHAGLQLLLRAFWTLSYLHTCRVSSSKLAEYVQPSGPDRFTKAKSTLVAYDTHPPVQLHPSDQHPNLQHTKSIPRRPSLLFFFFPSFLLNLFHLEKIYNVNAARLCAPPPRVLEKSRTGG